MATNKGHWYDGWFYDRWIAPNQDALFAQIKTLLPTGAKVLDVGCGTGRLAFALADTCSSVLGIDLSVRNIQRAQLRLSRTPRRTVSFKHTTVGEVLSNGREHFDYAVLTYVLHEMAEEERIPLLEATLKVADRVIIGDYLVPVPAGLGSFLDVLVERAAGKDHYRGFRSYIEEGGLTGLISRSPGEILSESRDTGRGRHLVVVRHREPLVDPARMMT